MVKTIFKIIVSVDIAFRTNRKPIPEQETNGIEHTNSLEIKERELNYVISLRI